MSIQDHPVYAGIALPWKERLQPGRKYGKYDCGRFERLVGSGHYLSSGKIGDVEVACKFLFRESRWGVLTPDRNPGGVVYIDVAFNEPADCRLKDATVVLTLDEEDKDLRRHFGAGNSPAKVPVHITEHGPRSLCGQLDEAFRVTRHSLNPWVEVGGIAGASGFEYSSEEQRVRRSQWKFSSFTMPNRLTRPTVLKWHLVESELDDQPRHDNTFHTAFAFEHDGQPFFMQVEVGGSLEGIGSHLRYKAKQKFKRFKFPAEPQIATTLVNFGGRDNPFKSPLDELAMSIPCDMNEKNGKHFAQTLVQSPNPRLDYEILKGKGAVPIKEGNNSLDPNHLSPSTGLLDSMPIDEYKEVASAVMSLGRLNLFKSDRRPEMPTPDWNERPETANRTPSTRSSQAETPATSYTLIDQDQDEVTSRGALVKTQVDLEKVQRLLDEIALPMMIQLIILWIITFGAKISPSPKNTSVLKKDT
ncbi:hypothetical protein AAE478_001656 [Parahypoxylon ruwenzoriense]